MEVRYIFTVLVSYLISVECIMWNLEPGARKCLREELQKDVLVIGEFEVSEAPGQTIDYIVSFKYETSMENFSDLFLLGNRFERAYSSTKTGYYKGKVYFKCGKL